MFINLLLEYKDHEETNPLVLSENLREEINTLENGIDNQIYKLYWIIEEEKKVRIKITVPLSSPFPC